MRRHGATVAGTTLEEAVFRSINGCLNAEYQLRAMAIGTISPLNAAEARDASAFNLQQRPMARAWEYWTLRLGERGTFPTARRAAVKKAAARKAKAAPRKRAKAVAKKRRR
jgi:HCOMODA/2-hydroxy-3-carboxy-muconic semialdehyde decarboxylase